jgi:ribosome recycling factor
MKFLNKQNRTGKVTTGIIDNIKVDYYGTMTALNQVGNVIATDATTISITPWEKTLLPVIEKAIQEANIGVNPNNDGDFIKLFFPPMTSFFPPMTSDQRQEIVKQAKGMVEHAKVSIRNVRKDGNDKIKKLEKDKEVSEDESKKAQDQIQKITDEYIAKIEEAFKTKEADILKV